MSEAVKKPLHGTRDFSSNSHRDLFQPFQNAGFWLSGRWTNGETLHRASAAMGLRESAIGSNSSLVGGASARQRRRISMRVCDAQRLGDIRESTVKLVQTI